MDVGWPFFIVGQLGDGGLALTVIIESRTMRRAIGNLLYIALIRRKRDGNPHTRAKTRQAQDGYGQSRAVILSADRINKTQGATWGNEVATRFRKNPKALLVPSTPGGRRRSQAGS